MADRIVFVEDSLARATEIRRLLDLYRSGEAMRSGKPVPRLLLPQEEYWDPATALQRISGGSRPDSAPGAGADRWDPDDLVFMDCWDRDAIDEGVGGYRTTFFALDLLRAFRGVAEAGGTVPRVIVHSRGMSDELLRAALGEFTVPRLKIRVEGETPVVRWRLGVRHKSAVRGSSGGGLGDDGPSGGGPSDGAGVIWAMFDRTELERNLDRILEGDRSGAMAVPGPSSVVWSQILPTSCLASFHCAMRDECPEIWDSFVLSRSAVSERAEDRDGPTGLGRLQLDATEVARVTRIARRYLDLNESWGVRGYRGYLNIARALANPEN